MPRAVLAGKLDVNEKIRFEKRLAGDPGMSPVGILTVFQAEGIATYCYIKDQ